MLVINQRAAAAAVLSGLKVVPVFRGKPLACVSSEQFTQGSSWQVEEGEAGEGVSDRTLQGVVGKTGGAVFDR